jgi:NADPH-dependent glutamate synthase beta subunit-like oxidoreductase
MDKEIREPLPGVILLLQHMLNLRKGEALPLGKKVMILEGGKAALETAEACLSQGSEEVHIVCRQSIEQSPYFRKFLEEDPDERIHLHFRYALTGMSGEGNRITHVTLKYLTGGDDEQGPEGDEQTVDIDILLTGAGRFPELIYVRDHDKDEETEDSEILPQPERLRWRTVTPYPSPYALEDLGLFRPGETISDYKAVVEAIGSGRRTANSVHRHLTGEEVVAPPNQLRSYTEILNIDDLEPVRSLPRESMSLRRTEERVNEPEIEIALGLDEAQARREARRCLQCGLICYRRSKATLH